MASFLTEIVSRGTQIKTAVCDKGSEFRNGIVLGRCAAHGVTPRFGGKGCVGKAGMIERAILTLKALRDRLLQHDMWKIIEQNGPQSFWNQLNMARNSTRTAVPKGLSPWGAQRVEPSPLLRKASEEFGDEDGECILEDWKKFRILERERGSLIEDSNYLVGPRKIAERIHRSISLKRRYRAGDNVEIKLRNGRRVKMLILARRDLGTSVFYGARSYLGSRDSDVPSRRVRPALSATDFPDLPGADVLRKWQDLTDAQLADHSLLDEGPVVGDPQYELNAKGIPQEPWPRCRRCGKQRRILHPETLPARFECKDVEGSAPCRAIR